MRGLTHRRVDRAAALPPGSTSYYARTRLALLELAIARMLELDDVDLGDLTSDVNSVAHAVAGFLHHSMTEGRARALARFEFALEATRRPELRAMYDEGGRRLRQRASALLVRLGSPEPERHARVLVSWCEGLIFDAVAGAGGTPSHDELVANMADLLAALVRVP